MRRAPRLITLGLPVLACWLSGCCHNHYYGVPSSACGPSTAQTQAMVVPYSYGAVCQVPSGTAAGSSGTVVSQSQSPISREPQMIAPAPKIIVSQPSDSRSTGLRGWRRTDPENLATTQVEGALDDDARRR